MSTKTATQAEWKPAMFPKLYDLADRAGKQAAEACNPRPMVVTGGRPGGPQQSWYVPDGVCGFAWIVIRPGNSPFANWLKKQGKARKHYAGGVSIWVSAYDQSMQRKEAYADAFAKVLSDAGFDAIAGSRMD